MSFKTGDVSIVDNTVTIIRQPTTSFSDISGGYDTTTLPIPLTGGDADEVKITAESDVDEFDNFGTSLALGSGIAAITCLDEIGGNPQGALGAGAIYLYRNISGPFWNSNNFIKRLEAPDAAASDSMVQVDVGCGRIVGGASGNDDFYTSMGAAYIWDTSGNFIKKILPINVQTYTTGQGFGTRVAVGDGRIAIGCASGSKKVFIYDLNGNGLAEFTPGYTISALAIGCGFIAFGTAASGRIRLYDLNGNIRREITQPAGYSGTGFAKSIAIGSGRLVVGNSSAIATDRGAVHVWKLDETNDFSSTPDFTITSPNPGDFNKFGFSVAVGDGRIVIGEPGLSSSRGRAHVYDLDGNLISALSAYDGTSADFYGNTVAVGGGKILVGAPSEDSDGINAGAVYHYDTPMQTHYLDQDKHSIFS